MNKLVDLMKELPENLDGALVTSPINRRYYTEFPSSAGTLVVTREASYLIIDARYFEVAEQKAKNCTVLLQNKLFEQIQELLQKHNVKTVGVEADTLTISQLAEFQAKLSAFEIVSDKTLSEQIGGQRAVKSQKEKEYLVLSQGITDKTFDYALGIIQPGRTEQEIALAMEMFSRQQGSEEPAFSFIVASGPNTSRPHAVPSQREIQKGDFVLLDFGSTYQGYRSDMTRTVAVGAYSEKQEQVYHTVLGAQMEAMKHIKAGVDMKEIHELAAAYIDASPFKGKFTHGLGHSLGLEVHESPNFNPYETKKAVVGNTVTIEPGIYLPGEFGVRIEDFVYITEVGFENFTGSPKEEIIVL